MPSSSCPQRTDVSLLRGHVGQQLPQGSSAAALHLQVRVLQPTSQHCQHACSTPSRCTSVRMAPSCSGHACRSCKTQCMTAWLAGGRHVAPHALTPPFTHAAAASSITHCLLPAMQWHMALVLRPWKLQPTCLCQAVLHKACVANQHPKPVCQAGAQLCIAGVVQHAHLHRHNGCESMFPSHLERPAANHAVIALHCCHGSASDIITATASHHEYAQV